MVYQCLQHRVLEIGSNMLTLSPVKSTVYFRLQLHLAALIPYFSEQFTPVKCTVYFRL